VTKTNSSTVVSVEPYLGNGSLPPQLLRSKRMVIGGTVVYNGYFLSFVVRLFKLHKVHTAANAENSIVHTAIVPYALRV